MRNTSFRFLLLALVLFTSCKGQVKTAVSESDQVTTQPKHNPTAWVSQPHKAPEPDPSAWLSQHVRRINQDQNGHLWFGTNRDGVIRYDGDSLEYFSINEGFSGTAVRGIVEDSAGIFWFGTEGGISKYDPSSPEMLRTGNPSFTNFTGVRDVWSVFLDSQGIIWIGTGNGVSRLSDEVITPLEISNAESDLINGLANSWVHTIMEDSQGKMWFGTDNGVYIYNPSADQTGEKSLSNLSTKDGLCDNRVNGILENTDGSFWFATHYKGVCRWDGKTFTPIGTRDGVNGTEVYNLFKDRAGNIWFPVEGFGVYRYDPLASSKVDSTSFTNFHDKEGLSSCCIQSFFEDKEGILWAGGYGGLYRYDGKSFSYVTKHGPWGNKQTSQAKNKTSQTSEYIKICLILFIKDEELTQIFADLYDF